MKKRGSVAALVLVTVLVITTCVNAEWAKTGKETLKGLDSLYVIIQKLPPDAAKIGLTSIMVRNDVELKLKGAGITVPFALVGKEEPYFNVVIDVSYDTTNDFVCYAMHLSLFQPVSLLRDPSLSCPARTWFISSTAGASKKESVKLLRDGINKHVEQFIDDYRAVNPKKTMQKGG